MAKRLTDDEIRANLQDEIRQSVGYHGGELSDQRKQALEYYYGEPFGNEVEGRSSYVSRDVADTIEWIMPALMKIFTASDNIVKFEPQEPNDEEAAKQATDYVNYLFRRQNDGFLTLYTWFKDALLSKNGFVKVYWEEKTEVKTETYDQLTEDEFMYLMQEFPEAEILEHTNEEGLHAIKLKTTQTEGKCCVIPVPPEEVLVSKNPVYPLSRNRFVAHRRRVTLGELKEMGFDAEGVTSDEDGDFNEERTTRFSYDETNDTDSPKDKDPQHIWLTECYKKIDIGNGLSFHRVIIAGNKVLEKEECDSIPFVTLTPILLPHKLFGMSIADLVMDIQLLKSTVFRQILDNMYLANNGRYMALDGMVNIDDLLTNRPGGIIRVKTFDAVKPIQPPLLGAPAFNLIEYIDTIKENRTGVTRYNQGIDANSLNKTATGINQIMTAAQQRVELIARVFAETGVKDLFWSILAIIQKHQDKPKLVRLKDGWVPMNPREWADKFDMDVVVGLGTGSQETLMNGVNQILAMQQTFMQLGITVVTPENFYNAAVKLVQAANIKGEDLFFTHPSKMPQQEPQQDPKLVEVQMDMQLGQQKLQLATQKAEAQTNMKQQQMQLQAQQQQQQLALEMERIKMEAMQEAEKIRMQATIDREKMQAMLQLERMKAQIEMMLEKEKMDRDDANQHRDRMAEVVAGFNDSMNEPDES